LDKQICFYPRFIYIFAKRIYMGVFMNILKSVAEFVQNGATVFQSASLGEYRNHSERMSELRKEMIDTEKERSDDRKRLTEDRKRVESDVRKAFNKICLEL